MILEEKMSIWLKTLLLFVVFNEVQLYRQLKNSTCLELAKPSNRQFRLTCYKTSYHCLLDENYTKEYEICKMWIWIPEEKCAYLNTYRGNIDARSCSSSAQMDCPKRQYRSEDSIIYTACYVKKNPIIIRPTASLIQAASNWTSNGNGRNATISLMLKTNGIIRNVLPTIMGIILPSVTIAVLYFIFMHLKYIPLYKRGTDIRSLNDDENVEQQPCLGNEMENNPENTSTMRHKNENRLNEARKKDRNKDDEEESSNVFDDTVESLQSNKQPKDEQDWCMLVYTLIAEDGWKLSQEVMSSVFTTMTGNSPKILLEDESVRESVKRVLPTESHFLLANNLNREKSIHVVYGLLQIYLDKKYHPKSGWGNPVREKDIGIGDDIDRLFRIVAITRDISNSSLEFIPKESYIRLLDIMIDALTRLGPSVISKKDFNALADKMKAIENQILIQPIIKKIENCIKYGDIY